MKHRGFTLIELLIVVAIIGIIAAIAIPALLRARLAANESAVVGDIRAVISAQAAYQSANSGWYDSNLSCLHFPSSGCVPNYPSAAPTFLDSALATYVAKAGYTRSFGSDAGPAACGTTCSPSSTAGYVYGAVAVVQNRTGVRSFAGEMSGLICFSRAGGAVPPNATGRVVPTVATCEILR